MTDLAAELVPAVQTVRPGDRLDYELVNTGQVPIEVSFPYLVERLEEDRWISCPVPAFRGLPVLTLAPGDSKELFAWVPKKTRPGPHRLLKHIGADGAPDLRVTVSCEFEVESGRPFEPMDEPGGFIPRRYRR